MVEEWEDITEETGTILLRLRACSPAQASVEGEEQEPEALSPGWCCGEAVRGESP